MDSIYSTAYKNKLREIFKKLIDILDKNEFTYFAAAGTAIGAVRHNDIIPWDDDIDILMPRVNYDQLLSLRNQLKKAGLEIVNMESTPGFSQGMTKIVDLNTTVWEKRTDKYISGVWVDIFPLDYFDGGIVSYIKKHKQWQCLFSNYLSSVTPLSFKYIASCIFHNKLRQLIIGVYSKINHSFKCSQLNNVLKYNKLLALQDGPCLVSFPDSYEGCYNKEWFASSILMDFSSFKVKMPIGYHNYLTLLYGDYMTPPKDIDNIVTHHMVYVNLTERLSKKEVIARLKQGEKFVI